MGLIYDLHCHSNASDGILRPEALVSRAKAQDVDVLALTDHDTLAGYAEAKVAAASAGVRLVCGVEFSSQWRVHNIHVVGLNLDPDSPSLKGAIEQQQQEREKRAEEIAARLEKLGFTGALASAQAYAGGASLGRPHFARFLVEKGHVASMNAAFKQYLGAGKVGDVKQGWPDIEQVVQWIKAAGGVAVLAHPDKYKMTRTKLRTLIGEFCEVGGRAMEVIAGRQPEPVSRDLARLCRQFGLLASCGSDFHAPDQPWQELGAFGTLPADCQPVWSAWE